MNSLKMRWRALVVLAVVVALVGLALAGCGKKSTSNANAGGTPKAGGTLNFPLDTDPGGIAPWTVYESEGWQVIHNTLEGLAKYVVEPDGSMKVVPCIADKWSSPDGKVWTITLKKGVMFQAPVSREVTAQDFVDDWNFNTDPKLGSFTAYIMAPIAGTDDTGYRTGSALAVQALDKYTLQVTLKYPFFDFPVTLGHPISMAFPLDYMKKVGQKAFEAKPVGTGPFMVTSWKHAQSIDLAKNPAWWQKSSTNGPFLDNVHFVIYQASSTSTSTQWLNFQKGTIDWSSVPPGQVAASLNMPQVKSGQWSAKKFPNLGIYYVNINWKDPLLGGAKGLPLRQALSYSADTNAIINVVNEGVPIAPNGLVPTGIAGSQLSSLPYPYDPAKAKALVAKLGKLPTLNYWFNTDQGHQKIAEALQAGWKQVGINVKLANYEWNTFNSYQRKAVSGDQLSRSGWLADYPSMDNFLYPLYQSSQSGLNGYSYYKNPQVDALLQQARGTADETQRLNLYAQAEKIILNDATTIPIYFYRNYRVWNSTRIGGLAYDPLQQANMWQVWVK